jgi:DNA polymerase
MSKKAVNQNVKYVQELIDIIEPDFNFDSEPINRFKTADDKDNNNNQEKNKKILELKNKINSIDNCILQNNSKNILMGDGNVNSPIMLIGEAPGEIEEKSGLCFQGEKGELLDKMLLAIDLKRDKIYLTYSINFRPPADRKPTAQEIKRYSIFLKEHISIIDPKIIILMGSTAMEALTGLNTKISIERGSWKEVILKNKTLPIMITFSPSYLIRYPENKKYSWDDLKKIRQRIRDLNIKI